MKILEFLIYLPTRKGSHFHTNNNLFNSLKEVPAQFVRAKLRVCSAKSCL